jgi:hypothetical protein
MQKENRNTWIVISIIVILCGLIFYFYNHAEKVKHDLMDSREYVKELENYQYKIKSDDMFFTNEVLRISGPDRIYRALEKYDIDTYNALKNKFKSDQPISYQYIKIYQKHIDTLYKTVVIELEDKTVIVPIEIVQNLVKVTGKVTVFNKKDSALVDLKVVKDTTKIIITILEDPRSHELKTAVTSNDPDMVVVALDTRVMKKYTMQKEISYILGCGITTKTNFDNWHLNITGGIEFENKGYGVLLQTHMFDVHFIEQLSLVGYIRF